MPIRAGSSGCGSACPSRPKARPVPGVPVALARRRGLLAFACGALAATGQAPLGLWPLALTGFAALFLLVGQAASPRQAARWAWIFGGGYFALALSWIVEPFLVDIARHGWMAPFALALMSFGLALFWGAAGWLAGSVRAGLARALVLALGLAVAELARTYVFTGFPWALIGHLWIGTPVMQLAAIAGAQGLTLIAVLGVALVAAGGRLGAGLALVIWAGCWAFGVDRLSRPAPEPEAGPPVVRLLQPNAPQHLKWRADMVPVFYERQLAYTAEDAGPRPDLIVWPETAVPVMLDRPRGVLQDISEAAGDRPVLFGVQRRDTAGAYNSLAVIDGQGALSHVYDKHHLVPFGEYMPLQPLFARLGIAGLAAEDVYGYTAGPGPQVLDLGPVGKVLPLICYEAVFPQDLRVDVRPDWLLQITNDAWFGAVSGPYQHLAQARLRAVEQGLPLLRSANTGVSAVIDARGRVVQALPLNTQGQLTAPVPPALAPTPYARTGDTPIGLLYLLATIAALALRRRLSS